MLQTNRSSPGVMKHKTVQIIIVRQLKGEKTLDAAVVINVGSCLTVGLKNLSNCHCRQNHLLSNWMESIQKHTFSGLTTDYLESHQLELGLDFD